MRELGFSGEWPKLNEPSCTTFRFTRKDRDWAVGEVVRVVLSPRSKKRRVLGTAEIVGKEPRKIPWHGRCDFEAPLVTNEEARADGFPDSIDKIGGLPMPKPAYFAMWEFLYKAYGPERLFKEPMNKLSLRWKERAG